jgi:hypothetical protein
VTEGVEQAEPSPEPPADEAGPSQVAIAVAVVAVLAILGFGGWLLTRGDDDSARSSEASATPTEATAESGPPTTTPRTTISTSPPTTAEFTTTAPTLPVDTAAVTGPPVVVPPPLVPETVAPDTVAPDTIAPETIAPETIVPDTIAPDTVATTAPTTPPSTAAPDPSTGGSRPDTPPLEELVPYVAAEAEAASSPQQQRATIDALLATPRHDVAAREPMAMLCATVSLQGPIRLGGRWQVDGRPLDSIEPADVGPPGFGDCVDAGGERLPDGAYQFVAVDVSGATSAAGTFVVGADPLDQPFRNNGDGEVCVVLVGPSSATFYESYRIDTAIGVGDVVTIRLASVRQDVRTIGCGGDEVLAEFSFDPESSRVQDLVP